MSARRRLRFIGFLSGAGALALVAVGCGYTFQTSSSPLAEREGVRKVYIAPMLNNSYKTGVENLVYNALLRTISSHRRVSLVRTPEEADAVLKGTVTLAQVDSIASTSIQGRAITSQYNANLVCAFGLERPKPKPGQKGVLWSSSFRRSKPFPSAVQTAVRGQTTALINDSEFDRTLVELANSMVADVHESMLAMF